MNTRTIGNRTIKLLGHVTADWDILSLNALTYHLARNGPIHCIEIGSWVGESANAICAALPPGSSLICVDHWLGNQHDILGEIAQQNPGRPFQLFCENTAGLPIQAVRGQSTEVAALLPPQNANLIYIDAEHTYEALNADIDAWLPHLAPNGVIAGHDYHTA